MKPHASRATAFPAASCPAQSTSNSDPFWVANLIAHKTERIKESNNRLTKLLSKNPFEAPKVSAEYQTAVAQLEQFKSSWKSTVSLHLARIKHKLGTVSCRTLPQPGTAKPLHQKKPSSTLQDLQPPVDKKLAVPKDRTPRSRVKTVNGGTPVLRPAPKPRMEKPNLKPVPARHVSQFSTLDRVYYRAKPVPAPPSLAKPSVFNLRAV